MVVFEEIIVVVLQLILELLIELILWLPWDLGLSRREGNPQYRMPDPWVAGLGGAALGGLFGGCSLLVVPSVLIQNELARLLNLLISPLICGLLSFVLTTRRRKRGTTTSTLIHFWFALLFSLAFLTVRFTWGTR